MLGDTKIEVDLGILKVFFRKLNLSHDWFGNFECRFGFASFQRPTL